MTTRVFPRLESDRMALKLNGKDDRLNRSDFRALAATMGLKAGEADEELADMMARLTESMDRLKLPAIPVYEAENAAMRDRILDIVRARLASVE